MAIVISLGGGMMNPTGKPDISFLRQFCGIINKSRERFGILVGGGNPARVYVRAAKELGANEYDADEIAIMTTKINAYLTMLGMKDSAKRIARDFKDARELSAKNRVVVMGGTIPGITTDTDAVLLAEAIGAERLVNISRVEGIYDSDPAKNKKAKKYVKMSYDELITLANKSDQRKAGTNFVFDSVACKLAKRSKINLHFVNGRKSEMEKAIKGKKHNGTIVK